MDYCCLLDSVCLVYWWCWFSGFCILRYCAWLGVLLACGDCDFAGVMLWYCLFFACCAGLVGLVGFVIWR